MENSFKELHVSLGINENKFKDGVVDKIKSLKDKYPQGVVIVKSVDQDFPDMTDKEAEIKKELCSKNVCTTDDLYNSVELAEYLEIMQLIEDVKKLHYRMGRKIDEIIKKYGS